MAKPKNDPALSLLKEKYKLVDGEVYERLVMDGEEVLFLPNTFNRGGYRTLYISKNKHFAYHRAVWMLTHDCQIPRDENGDLYIVDHFDGNKFNNRSWNLRLATDLENRNNLGQTLLFAQDLI